MSNKIIEDLTHIPNIIAGLGLSIAEAQRHFDLDYLQSVERLLVMAQSMLGGQKSLPATAGSSSTATTELTAEERKQQEQFQALFKELLIAVAPSRYQFTETTLTVKLDLAQHIDVSAGVGLSAGIGGVAINAALSIGYGSDYRGAAECKTILQAVPADQATLRLLLDRAKDLSAKDLSMPERSKVAQCSRRPARFTSALSGVRPLPLVKAVTPIPSKSRHRLPLPIHRATPRRLRPSLPSLLPCRPIPPTRL